MIKTPLDIEIQLAAERVCYNRDVRTGFRAGVAWLLGEIKKQETPEPSPAEVSSEGVPEIDFSLASLYNSLHLRAIALGYNCIDEALQALSQQSPARVEGEPIGYRIISRNTGKTMGYYYTEKEARDLFDIYFAETLNEVRPMFDALNQRLAVKDSTSK